MFCRAANREIGVSGTRNQNGEPGGSPFQRFCFCRLGAFRASGGSHRVRGVLVAVCVLSPVESSSPPKLFEQQFPCTPIPHLWQERLCNFRRSEIQGNQSHLNPYFMCDIRGKSNGRLILRRGLPEVGRDRQTFWRSGTERTGLKFPGSEKHVAAERGRLPESIPGFERPGHGSDGK